MTSIEASHPTERMERSNRTKQLSMLVASISELLPFPWEDIESKATPSAREFSDETIQKLSQALSALDPQSLNFDELELLDIFLRTRFELTLLRKHTPTAGQTETTLLDSQTKESFRHHLNSYLSQVKLALKIAEEQTGWLDLGIFPETSPDLSKAVANPLVYTKGLRYRVIPRAVENDSNEMYFALQARSMTYLDIRQYHVDNAHKRAKKMLYFFITGEFPDDTADWHAVSEAIETGSFSSWLGFRYNIDWTDLGTVLTLSSKFEYLQRLIILGHPEWCLDDE